jgi:hypothetical protein
MRDSLGHDFSAVRIHTDALADQSARAVGANAYTVGSHVVFRRGRYEPRTPPGRTLLAHELAHVAQQGAAALATPPVLGVTRPDDPAEREATAAAHAASSGTRAPRLSRTSIRVARQAALAYEPMPEVEVEPEVEPEVLEGEAEPLRHEARGPRYAGSPRTLEGGLRRRAWDYRREEAIREAERPTATLQRGGAPPDFVTVDRMQEGAWSWGNATYRSRLYHVLDAIEYRVMRATTDDALARVLWEEVGVASVTSAAQTARVRLWGEEPVWPSNLDPGAQRRLEVYSAAVQRRTAQVPSLASAPAAAPARVTAPEGTRRRGCIVTPAAPLGEELDPLATVFCNVATRSSVMLEYRVTAPTGESVQYDSMSGDVVYECKCGYLGVVRDLRSSEPWRRARAERRLQERDAQMLRQQRVAAACGLRLRYLVSNREFAELLRSRWFGVDVQWTPWTECD